MHGLFMFSFCTHPVMVKQIDGFIVGLAVPHRPESTFSLKEHTLIHAAITVILIHVFLSNFK